MRMFHSVVIREKRPSKRCRTRSCNYLHCSFVSCIKPSLFSFQSEFWPSNKLIVYAIFLSLSCSSSSNVAVMTMECHHLKTGVCISFCSREVTALCMLSCETTNCYYGKPNAHYLEKHDFAI